jgi:hypothetical protein
MSRLALFCSVDASWQLFALRWQQELLARGGRRTIARSKRFTSNTSSGACVVSSRTC